MPRTVDFEAVPSAFLKNFLLPDISGEFLTGGFEGGNTGAFSVTEYRGQPLAVADQGSFQVLKRHKFSASGFKAIFGKSETNQNASLRLLAIVKI